MAWSDEVIPVIRLLINDYNSPVTYTDNRLIDTALVSAQLLLTEISFDNSYTISLSSCSISPDPSSDDSFINLVSMKAACIILGGEAKTEALNSVRITDGPTTIDLANRSKDVFQMYQSMIEIFESAKLRYMAGNSIGGQAIMTPYTVE